MSARILIVGGSLGGLFAANLLHRAGHEVRVLEKAGMSLDGRGAGIVTHSGLLAALRAAGVVVDDNLGVTVSSRIELDARGEVVARCEYTQLLTSWSRLYALLRAALPDDCYLAAHEVLGVAQNARGVAVTCRQGQRLDADLLIASDGIRSPVREQFAPAVAAHYAGYVAWRGVCEEAALSSNTRDRLFDYFGFGLPPHEQIIGYPVAGADNTTRRGARRFNFVWYRPAREHDELRALLTDDQGVHHAQGIAPHKVSARALAQMRQAAREKLAPQWVEVIDKTVQPFLQPIHDLVSERIAFDRVALMGDAAFVARPHVGMGVTKAADDALALRDAIGRHGATPLALQHYEHQRLAAGRAVVERARRLGAYLQAAAHGDGARRPQQAAPERDAQRVLEETAIDLALTVRLPDLLTSAPARPTHSPRTTETRPCRTTPPPSRAAANS